MTTAARRRKPTWILSVAIVLFWLAMMYTLVKDAIIPRVAARQILPLDLSKQREGWRDVLETYEIVNREESADGRVRVTSIGGARFKAAKTEKPIGFRADFAARVRAKVILQVTLKIQVAVQLDDDFNMTDFNVKLEALNMLVTVVGSVAPDNKLLARSVITRVIPGVDSDLQPPSVEDKLVILLDGPVSMIDAVRPIALRGASLEPGLAYSFDVIDPIWQMSRGETVIVVEEHEQINVAGEPYNAARTRTDFGGTSTLAWLERSTGRLLRRQLIPDRSLMMELCAPEKLEKYKDVLEAELPIIQQFPEDFEGVAPKSIGEIDFGGLVGDLDFLPKVEHR